MFEFIAPYFFQIWSSFKTASNHVFDNVKYAGTTLAQRYPNQAFQVFWMYNYYAVLIIDFMERHQLIIRNAGIMSMPIEETYFARFFCYDSIANKKHLYFESSPHIILITKPTQGETHLYKTPEYALCGTSLPLSIEAHVKSRAKFINIIFSNASTPEPLTLKLDPAYYQVGNEVLTAAHVLLLLSTTYESNKYVFDNDYEIKIMDSAINMTTLKSTEWIKFDDSAKGYIKKGNSSLSAEGATHP
jgi:hypothetical protein